MSAAPFHLLRLPCGVIDEGVSEDAKALRISQAAS